MEYALRLASREVFTSIIHSQYKRLLVKVGLVLLLAGSLFQEIRLNFCASFGILKDLRMSQGT